MPSDDAAVPRRERVRASTIEEIKTTARRLMAESGTVEVRFSDIAREMGLTAPALYRYFRDRDELLTALISDGYDDLANQLHAARASVAPGDPWGQLLAVSEAYRRWALEDPSRYALVFGMPIPGFAMPDDATTTMNARRAMGALVAVLEDAERHGLLDAPPAELHDVRLEDHLSDKLVDVPVERHHAAMHVWMAMHGFVSLEAFGHLAELPRPGRDRAFAAQVRLNGRVLGLRGG
jgi:AcrR family transcriptional regulator